MSSRLSLWPHQAAYGLSRARKDLNIAELERLTVAWRVSLERDTGDGERRQRSVDASLRWATWEMVGQALEHGWTISPLAFSAFVRAEMGRMRQQQRMAGRLFECIDTVDLDHRWPVPPVTPECAGPPGANGLGCSGRGCQFQRGWFLETVAGFHARLC